MRISTQPSGNITNLLELTDLRLKRNFRLQIILLYMKKGYYTNDKRHFLHVNSNDWTSYFNYED